MWWFLGFLFFLLLAATAWRARRVMRAVEARIAARRAARDAAWAPLRDRLRS